MPLWEIACYFTRTFMEAYMQRFLKAALLVVPFIFAPSVFAEQLTVKILSVSEHGVGTQLGTVSAEDTQFGLLLTPALSGLTPGLHGFHVHQNPSCEAHEKDGKPVAAHAAGGHLDPDNTKTHQGPYSSKGHLGDLPALYVDAQGKASLPVLAPKLHAKDLRGRALMIHQGGDTYSDTPELGGGGPRIACGVIE
jgi:superoxide dismutase, Cu-Zn family